MDIDELRTVQTKERQKDSLQHLRDSFYEDVAAYIQELKSRRTAAAETADDPFSDPEVSQLTDEIETAEDVVEAVYERRVGKVVKLASFAAADMPVDEEGLTVQERDLFEDLVGRIGENKDRVLEILAGEGDRGPAPGPTGSAPVGAAPDPTPGRESTPERGPEHVAGGPPDEPDAADTDESAGASSPGNETLSRAEPAVATGEEPTPADTEDVPPAPPERPPDEAPPEGGPPQDRVDETSEPDSRGRPDGGVTTVETQRTTVRITADVGQLLGMDDREYDLRSEDVVSLPEENADALLQRDAAEELSF
jgi:DNA replication factor GINS